MNDHTLERLARIDPASGARVEEQLRQLGDVTGRIVASARVDDAAPRRVSRRHRRPGAVALVAAVLVIAVVVPLALLARLGGGRDGTGFLDDGWYAADSLQDIEAAGPVAYLPEIDAFVVTRPDGGLSAFEAASPHLAGESLVYCRTSEWFFSPAHGESFDRLGHYILGPAASDMIGLPVRVSGGIVEVDRAHPFPPEPRSGVRQTLTGPHCNQGYTLVSPGIADAVPFHWSDITIAPQEPAPHRDVTSPLVVSARVDGVTHGDVVVQLVTTGSRTVSLADTLIPLEAIPGGRGFSVELSFSVDEPTPAQVYMQVIGTDDPGTLVEVTALPGAGHVVSAPGPTEGFTGQWVDPADDPVHPDVLSVFLGTEGCGGGDVVVLRLGPQPGTLLVRDPLGTLDASTWAPFDVLEGLTTVPERAEDTGYRTGSWHLWRPTEDAGVVYLVRTKDGAVTIERWGALISPPAGCG